MYDTYIFYSFRFPNFTGRSIDILLQPIYGYSNGKPSAGRRQTTAFEFIGSSKDLATLCDFNYGIAPFGTKVQ